MLLTLQFHLQFFHTDSICSRQLKTLSMKQPKNLKLFTHSITELFKYNTGETDCLKQNNICFVLDTLSLIAANQYPIQLHTCCSLAGAVRQVMSSANNINRSSGLTLYKSFIFEERQRFQDRPLNNSSL